MKKASNRHIKLFAKYIKEREYRRAEVEYARFNPPHPIPPPRDKAFIYRYSNVRRIDDRMSLWLLVNYYPHFKPKQFYFAAIAARYFNHPPTLEALLPILKRWNDSKAIAILAKRRKQGLQIFGSSYTIYTRGKLRKHIFICRFLTRVRQHSRQLQFAIHKQHSFQQCSKILQTIPGVGEFMAGQIAADLSYITFFWDKDLYTPMGPGSYKGLNLIYNLPPNTKWKEEEYLEALKKLREHMPWTPYLHDVQNALCGFQKYHGAKHGKRYTIYTPHPEPMPELRRHDRHGQRSGGKEAQARRH